MTASAETLSALMDAFNTHDVDQIMGFFADDASYDASRGPEAFGRRVEGKEAIREAFAGLFAATPDVHYDADRNWVSGDLGVSEWLVTGTGADGVPFAVRGCDHWEFRDGKIVRKDAYWKIIEKSN